MNNPIFSDKGRAMIRATFRSDKATAVESAIRPRYMNTKRIINLLAVIITAAVGPVTWAAEHGGRGGVVSGGHVGGFGGGISRAAPAFYGRGLQTTPAFQGAYFTGRSIGGVSRASHSYYNSAGMPAITSHGVSAFSNRPTRIAGRTSPIRSQQDRPELRTRQSTGVANSQAVATNRQSNVCRTEPHFRFATVSRSKPSVVRQEPRVRAA